MEFKKKEVLIKKDIVIVKKKDLFKYITNYYENINPLSENKSNNKKLLGNNELDPINDKLRQ